MLEQDVVDIYKKSVREPALQVMDLVSEKAYGVFFRIGSGTKSLYENKLKKMATTLKIFKPTMPVTISDSFGLTAAALVACMSWAPVWYDWVNKHDKNLCLSHPEDKIFYACSSNIENTENKNILNAELTLASFGLVLGGAYALYLSLPKNKK